MKPELLNIMHTVLRGDIEPEWLVLVLRNPVSLIC